MTSGDRALACTPEELTPEARRSHFARIPRLLAAVLERRDLPNGYALRFEADRLEDIAGFVANERKCCPFLDIAIEVSARNQGVWLRMTGPEGTRELLDQACDDASQYPSWVPETQIADAARTTKGNEVLMTEDIRAAVRQAYTEIAVSGSGCCGPDAACESSETVKEASLGMGYSDDELDAVPDGANMGLGCGNPLALAALRPGDVVLDLGSGGGFDCFLAAQRVGRSGRVMGVDMTPAMVVKARENARNGGYANVEFRLGEIEALPVPDDAVDVVISNCVVNLSPDKPRVFQEAFRVLRQGGRIAIADLVFEEAPSQELRASVTDYAGCVAGASPRDEYLQAVRDAGFVAVKVVEESAYQAGESCGVDAGSASNPPSVVSIKVSARKP